MMNAGINEQSTEVFAQVCNVWLSGDYRYPISDDDSFEAPANWLDSGRGEQVASWSMADFTTWRSEQLRQSQSAGMTTDIFIQNNVERNNERVKQDEGVNVYI